jgi:predicted O-linked N-acetylglucosamine transferase (SPINDLY family)
MSEAVLDEAALRARVDAHPSDAEARFKLASVLLRDGARTEAAAMLDDARILQALALARGLGVDLGRSRVDPDYAANVAAALYAQNQVTAASVLWGMAIRSGRTDAQTLVNYGLALQHQGRAEEAITVFRAAVEVSPIPVVHQFLLFPQLFCDGGEDRHAKEARAWAALHAPETSAPMRRNPPRAGRRLRIGYVAPRFCGAQLHQFIAPLLEGHDPQTVAVVLYPAEAGTEQGWPDWIEVHPIGGLDDAAAAARIRGDGIDVLLDCWGHTAGSRLGVFARKPAPVQAGWLNFHQTTGLPQMDYVLHATDDDEATVDPSRFTETVWPIGPVFNVFRPSPGRLPPVGTPALASGRITFGSFNHPAKLSDPVVNVWSAILRASPSARLLLKYRYFEDPVLQRATQARFAAHGVAEDRIAFEGHSAGAAYYEAFRRVDLALDTWPAPGSTTTFEAVSNGVPVLVLAPTPATLAGRYARSIMVESSLPELVATSHEDFVAKALHLTGDLRKLDQLRARVRPGFEAGGYCDEAAFVRRAEAAFQDMFEVWAQGAERVLGAA